MRTTKEWCAQLAADADRVEDMTDEETEAHAVATIRAVQQDALEAAALECRSHPEDTEWDGYGQSFEEAIRKLKEQA